MRRLMTFGYYIEQNYSQRYKNHNILLNCLSLMILFMFIENEGEKSFFSALLLNQKNFGSKTNIHK